REPDQLALHVGAGVLECRQRLGVAAKDDTDLLEDGVGVVLEQGQALLVQHLEWLEGARQERRTGGVRSGLPRGMSRLPTTAGTTAPFGDRVGHRRLSVRRLLRRSRRRAASDGVGRRAGSSTAFDRCVGAADAWGMAMASTKCCWKRGSTAVSIFSTVLTTRSISWRASADRSAISAPVPAAFPAAPTWSTRASGTSPSTRAWSGSIWLPNAPASFTRSTASTPRWSIRSLAPAYSAAFASWIARTSFWVISRRGDAGPTSPSPSGTPGPPSLRT